MPTPTYDLIASNVLGSSAASVTFSSIPATYRDLVLVVEASVTSGGEGLKVQLNSDTGNNYSTVIARGDGSATASGSTTTNHFDWQGMNILAGQNSLYQIQFQDYSATDKHTSVLCRGNRAGGVVLMGAGRWADTSAVSTMLVATTGVDFTSGSSFYLYGIVS